MPSRKRPRRPRRIAAPYQKPARVDVPCVWAVAGTMGRLRTQRSEAWTSRQLPIKRSCASLLHSQESPSEASRHTCQGVASVCPLCASAVGLVSTGAPSVKPRTKLVVTRALRSCRRGLVGAKVAVEVIMGGFLGVPGLCAWLAGRALSFCNACAGAIRPVKRVISTKTRQGECGIRIYVADTAMAPTKREQPRSRARAQAPALSFVANHRLHCSPT